MDNNKGAYENNMYGGQNNNVSLYGSQGNNMYEASNGAEQAYNNQSYENAAWGSSTNASYNQQQNMNYGYANNMSGYGYGNNMNPVNSSYNNCGIRDYNPNMDYNPIGMWGYFGYSILFIIPLVGFICALIFAFGGTRNINLRNFARSLFCGWIISIIIAAIVIAVVAMSAPRWF